MDTSPTGRGWYLLAEWPGGIQSYSGPWPTRGAAQARRLTISQLHGFNVKEAGQYPPSIYPENGRRWFLEGEIEPGIEGLVGPFHSRKAATKALEALRLKQETGTMRPIYKHDASRYQRTWLARQGFDKPGLGTVLAALLASAS